MKRLSAGLSIHHLLYILPILTVLTLPAPASGYLGIIRSRETQSLIGDKKLKNTYNTEVNFFQVLAEQHKLNYRIVGDYELSTKVKNYTKGIIVFPDWTDAVKVKNILRAIQKMKRIVIIGNSLNPNRNFFSHLSTCKKFTPKTFKKPAWRYFILKGNTFLSSNLIPAVRFSLPNEAPQFYVTDDKGQAFYTDWNMTALKPSLGFSGNVSISRFQCGSTEVLWLGFPLSQATGDSQIASYLETMKHNVIRWLAGQPIIGVPFWPGAQNAAVVVTCDVEHLFRNAENLAIGMKKYNKRGTYFVVGEYASKFPEVVSALADTGEIGSHSMHHEDFSKKSLEEQMDELTEFKRIMKKLGANKIVGFRPPYEAVSVDTLRVLKRLKIPMIFGLSDYAYSYPVIRNINGYKIYQFPRIVLDDYNILTLKKAKSNSEYAKWFIRELKRMMRFAGIFPFALHTTAIAKKEMMGIFYTFMDFAIKQNVKFMTFTDIIKWIQKKNTVQILRKKNKIIIRNSSKKRIGKFPIVLYNLNGQRPSKYFGKILPCGGYLIAVDLLPGNTVISLAP